MLKISPATFYGSTFVNQAEKQEYLKGLNKINRHFSDIIGEKSKVEFQPYRLSLESGIVERIENNLKALGYETTVESKTFANATNWPTSEVFLEVKVPEGEIKINRSPSPRWERVPNANQVKSRLLTFEEIQEKDDALLAQVFERINECDPEVRSHTVTFMPNTGTLTQTFRVGDRAVKALKRQGFNAEIDPKSSLTANIKFSV